MGLCQVGYAEHTHIGSQMGTKCCHCNVKIAYTRQSLVVSPSNRNSPSTALPSSLSNASFPKASAVEITAVYTQLQDRQVDVERLVNLCRKWLGQMVKGLVKMNQNDFYVNSYVYSILQYLQFLNTCYGVKNQKNNNFVTHR